MQVLGMYGYVDKYDFVIAVARVLNIMGRSVLVIDATKDKKYKYIVPTIDKEESYMTQYCDIDFAVGFDTYADIEKYMQEKNIEIDKYSYVIIDLDDASSYEKFTGIRKNKVYLFTNTNMVSVNKNDELVKKIRSLNGEKEISCTKVIYRSYLSRAATNYIEEKMSNYGVKWAEEVYDITPDEQDNMVDIDSEYSGLVDIRKHTKDYIYYISEFVSKILGDEVTQKEIIKEIKRRKN